ncbi:MAG: hypothetical protein ACXWLM_00675 [Myxococcales bacterium]
MSESAPYKFGIKDAPNAVATPAAGDGSVKEALQVFRFKLKTKDGAAAIAAIAVAQPDLAVSELRWETQDLDHGSETVLHAKIANWDGKPLKFVVEHDAAGDWRPYAEVPAEVKGTEVTGKLRAHHPVLPPTGSLPSAAKLREAKTAGLRFSLERGKAAPQPAAEPQPPVKATTTPKPQTEAGSLEVKGAFAGEPFFLLDAKTSAPVRAAAKGLVKTDAQSVNGVYFFLGKDCTARFDGLPAGKYRVVFPPEQSTEDAQPPKVRANSEGAHVVAIADFATSGAACEIEVPAGGTPKVELTLGADGVAHVCC